MEEPQHDFAMPDPGKILVAAGLITQEVLDAARAEEQRTNVPATQILVTQGHVSETIMARAIAGPPAATPAPPPFEPPPISFEPPISGPPTVEPVPVAVEPPLAAVPEPTVVVVVDPRIAELEAELAHERAAREAAEQRVPEQPGVVIGPVTVYAPAAVVEVDGERYAIAKLDHAAADPARVVAAFKQS
jgi:hypothetical protein